MLRRVGRDAYPLQVLYVLEPEVDVQPRWHLRQTAGDIAPRAFPFHWQAELAKATRSAR